MPEVQLSPLLIALASSIAGNVLLTWHRHGGAKWMFALGGFCFILGRVLISAICAFLLYISFEVLSLRDGDGTLLVALIAFPALGIGGWSIFAIVRSVARDAFGPKQEETATAQ